MKKLLFHSPLIVFVFGLMISSDINAQPSWTSPIPCRSISYRDTLSIGGRPLLFEAKAIQFTEPNRPQFPQCFGETSELEQAVKKLIIQVAQRQGIPLSNQQLLQAVREITNDMIQKRIQLFSTISISRDIRDEVDSQIDTARAPFSIQVKGTVSYARCLYVYLVVKDRNAEWIEPIAGFGAGVDGEFLGPCFLGEEGRGLRSWYSVSAVVTKKEYKAFDQLDRRYLVVQSNVVKLFRTR